VVVKPQSVVAHAVSVAACHCFVASALKTRSVMGER
jgi:hypothetical protein